MAITSTGTNAALETTSSVTAPRSNAKDGNPNGILGKDDFLKLLLVELQYQDPTAPTDTEKILSQTSQLASLESAQNTNDALEKLSKSLSNAQEFSIVSSIGKRADLGSDAIAHEEGDSSTFEVYFPEDIASGTVDIRDLKDNLIATIPIVLPKDSNGDVVSKLDADVYKFTWDGLNTRGEAVDSGIYRVSSKYTDPNGDSQKTRLGAYPIESVKFEDGKALLKLGSNYVPLSEISEVY